MIITSCILSFESNHRLNQLRPNHEFENLKAQFFEIEILKMNITLILALEVHSSKLHAHFFKMIRKIYEND